MIVVPFWEVSFTASLVRFPWKAITFMFVAILASLLAVLLCMHL